MTKHEPSSDRRDLHNAAVDVEAALAGRCGFTHLPSGRVCLLPQRHRHDCRFDVPPGRQRTCEVDGATAGSPPEPPVRVARTRQVPSGSLRVCELVQSVGAALREVGVALAAGGSAVVVRRLSRPNHRDPLAVMEEGMSPAGPAPVLLTAADDDQPASQQAREALQRVWLELTQLDLAAGPTAQPRPAPQTPDKIRIELVGGASPQMLLWIGGTQPTDDTQRRARA